MDITGLARLAKLYRETHDKDAGRRLDAAIRDALHPPQPGLFDEPCDHAWLPQVGGGFRCEKCDATSADPPRGEAGTRHMDRVPNQGGEK